MISGLKRKERVTLLCGFCLHVRTLTSDKTKRPKEKDRMTTTESEQTKARATEAKRHGSPPTRGIATKTEIPKY